VKLKDDEASSEERAFVPLIKTAMPELHVSGYPNWRPIAAFIIALNCCTKSDYWSRLPELNRRPSNYESSQRGKSQ